MRRTFISAISLDVGRENIPIRGTGLINEPSQHIGQPPLVLARVIIADDHLEMQKAVALLLKPDFDVLTVVADGRTALESVMCSSPELLILDISMPFLSGLDVARRLKANGSKTKIIFLTVDEDPDIAREAIAAGGLAYVVKSRMAIDLRFAMREVLAGRVFISASLNLGHTG